MRKNTGIFCPCAEHLDRLPLQVDFPVSLPANR
jgi:hypothetical protein